MGKFDGKVVIVTGGAQGIGRGICEAFGQAGASVLCADVNEKTGQAMAADKGSAGSGKIRFHKANVSLNADCEALVARVVSDWGGVDVLCNNVGIQPPASYVPAHELPEDQWDHIINVNLKSFFSDDATLRAGAQEAGWWRHYQHHQRAGAAVNEGSRALCSQQRRDPVADPTAGD